MTERNTEEERTGLGLSYLCVHGEVAVMKLDAVDPKERTSIHLPDGIS